MKAFNELNERLNSNQLKVAAIKEDNLIAIKEALKMVHEKISSLITDYNVTDRKAIKIVQTGMFEPKNKDDKLNNKIKLAIKSVVIAYKRGVQDDILWDDLSINKIDEILSYLTVNEIKTIKTIEDIKPLLDSKKVREVTSKTYNKKK